MFVGILVHLLSKGKNIYKSLIVKKLLYYKNNKSWSCTYQLEPWLRRWAPLAAWGFHSCRLRPTPSPLPVPEVPDHRTLLYCCRPTCAPVWGRSPPSPRPRLLHCDDGQLAVPAYCQQGAVIRLTYQQYKHKQDIRVAPNIFRPMKRNSEYSKYLFSIYSSMTLMPLLQSFSNNSVPLKIFLL